MFMCFKKNGIKRIINLEMNFHKEAIKSFSVYSLAQFKQQTSQIIIP